jgi:hypothetical protein
MFIAHGDGDGAVRPLDARRRRLCGLVLVAQAALDAESVRGANLLVREHGERAHLRRRDEGLVTDRLEVAHGELRAEGALRAPREAVIRLETGLEEVVEEAGADLVPLELHVLVIGDPEPGLDRAEGPSAHAQGGLEVEALLIEVDRDRLLLLWGIRRVLGVLHRNSVVGALERRGHTHVAAPTDQRDARAAAPRLEGRVLQNPRGDLAGLGVRLREAGIA